MDAPNSPGRAGSSVMLDSNPTTGERVKVDNTHNHTYTENNGNYYQSNAPLESNDVNWQGLEIVPFDDY